MPNRYVNEHCGENADEGTRAREPGSQVTQRDTEVGIDFLRVNPILKVFGGNCHVVELSKLEDEA